MAQRLEKLLVDKGLAATRTQAQKLIGADLVEAKVAGVWQVQSKAAAKVPDDWVLRVGQHPDMRFVSRAGLKLEAALKACELDVAGMNALDIGQSTGGFTDCLLQFGAAKVVGIEVGHGQLAAPLREDARVLCLEGINARYLTEAMAKYAFEPFDIAVMDVSFISQTLILPHISAQLKAGGYLATLVKPQFEVGPEGLSRGGIVRDEALLMGLEEKFTAFIAELGFEVIFYGNSPIAGGDGNTEFLLVGQLGAAPPTRFTR